MKFGLRTPSLRKSIAARTSLKRVVRHSMGFKAPRGYGWITNPKRAAYNRVYNRTTFSAGSGGFWTGLGIMAVFAILGALISGIVGLFQKHTNTLSVTNNSENCPRCNSEMVLRNGRRGQFYGCSRFPNCRGSRDYLPSAASLLVDPKTETPKEPAS